MKRFTGFLLLNLGLLFVAAGIHFFKAPNSFATGGVSGAAIILDHFFANLSVGALMMIINIIFLVFGFIMLGKEFIGKTIYSSLVLSGMVWLLDTLAPISAPLTGETVLELVYAIMLPAVGSAIVFNLNASTGGTDIIAKVLSKYTSIDIGKALLASDFMITVFAGIVYGIRTGMYSFMGLILKGFLIDMVIEGFNTRKQVVIVSEKPEEIRQYIIRNIHRGATIHEARGAFTGEVKHVITSVMGRKQALDLRNFIRKTDKDAFITITNSSEIIGRGFRSV